MSKHVLAGTLALLWGSLWAAFLQFSRYGQWLAVRRTWITVVVGVGVDLLLGLIVLPAREVGKFAIIVSASSIGIIFRSIYNELKEDTN